MKLKHIGRTLVCLLLVCCLVFNISPIRAKASATAVAVGVGAAAVIAAIFIGLGPRPGEASDDFNMAVDACNQYLTDSTSFVTDGLINVWKMTNGKFYVDESLIDTVWNWWFNSGIVSSAASFAGAVAGTLSFADALEVARQRMYYAIVNWADGTTSIYYPAYALTDSHYPCYTYTTSKGVLYLTTACSTNYRWDSDTGSVMSSRTVDLTDAISYRCYTTGVDDGVSSSLDLIIDSLVDPSVSFATGYADWAAGAIAVPGTSTGTDTDTGTDEEEQILAYPLGMGQTMEETQSMLQTDVWTGTGTYVDTTTDTETGVITGTFADTAVGTFINSLIDALWTPFRWIGEKLDALGQWLSDILAGVTSIPEALSALWTSVIVEPVLQGISAIFVPSADFVTVKVDAVLAEFPFVAPIVETGQFIGSAMSGMETSPPIIYVDLGASRGSYELGGKVAFIDLTWYAEYKPTVDMLLSALLWIVFWWKMFKRLPGLISGMPGDFVMDGLNSIGLAGHLPSRNAAYEIQRRDNHNSIWRRR
ncbi:MAG: hypothetical protein IJZ39_02655 [Oscillospiraceae bacterium]|nr:hypothetical protein [Oscillospiraceae bacterium]